MYLFIYRCSDFIRSLFALIHALVRNNAVQSYEKFFKLLQKSSKKLRFNIKKSAIEENRRIQKEQLHNMSNRNYLFKKVCFACAITKKSVPLQAKVKKAGQQKVKKIKSKIKI